jgi:hypothetical protein
MFHRFCGASRCKNTKQSQWLQNNPGRSTRHNNPAEGTSDGIVPAHNNSPAGKLQDQRK